MTSLSRFVFVKTPSDMSKKPRRSAMNETTTHDFHIYTPSPRAAPSPYNAYRPDVLMRSPSLCSRKSSTDSWSTSSTYSRRSSSRSPSPASSASSLPTSRTSSPTSSCLPQDFELPSHQYTIPVVNDSYDSFLGVYHATVDRMQYARTRYSPRHR